MKRLIMVLIIVCMLGVGFAYAAEHSALSNIFTLDTRTRLGHSALSNIFILDTSNSPPVAVDDEYSTDERTPLTVDAADGALANDTDVDLSDTLVVDSFDNPSVYGGTVAMNTDGSFTYTPDDRFSGYDSFAYVASDGNGGKDTATVNITVNCVNQRGADITSLDFSINGTGVSGSFFMVNTSEGPYDVQITDMQISMEYLIKVVNGKLQWKEMTVESLAFTPQAPAVFSQELTVEFSCSFSEPLPDDAKSIRVKAAAQIFGAKKEFSFQEAQDLIPEEGDLLTAPAMVTGLPRVARLDPNYPNPFNPDTWIPYQLAQDMDVTIRIYDTTGILVRTLSLGHKPAGFYTTRPKAAYWDGRNETGEEVSSGIYFCTIQAGEFKATRKMIVMK